MAKIIIIGVEKEYREGTSYEAIANEYQAEYGNMIALVLEDYKIRELIKTVLEGGEAHQGRRRELARELGLLKKGRALLKG